MTETPSPAARQAAPAAEAALSADILMNLVVIFLAPVFLSACNGDIGLARLAAIETVKSYRAHSHADLLAVAQVVAFGFATLGSLCLSMADDLSLNMVLRLRGNANALSRSAEAHRRRLEQSHANASQPTPTHADDPWATPATVTPAAPPSHPAQPPVQDATPAPIPTTLASAIDPSDALWAAACAEAAEQVIAEMPHLPPTEQRMAAIQVAALNYCANDLLAEMNAQRPEPADAKAPERHPVQQPQK